MFNGLEIFLTYASIFGFFIPLIFNSSVESRDEDMSSIEIICLDVVMILSFMVFIWLASSDSLRFH